jgi:hypothetical protein
LQVEAVCLRTRHCLEKQGRDSYITYWVKGEPLGKTRFIEVGRSISRSTSIRTLTYESRVMEAVGATHWMELLGRTVACFLLWVLEWRRVKEKGGNWNHERKRSLRPTRTSQ